MLCKASIHWGIVVSDSIMRASLSVCLSVCAWEGGVRPWGVDGDGLSLWLEKSRGRRAKQWGRIGKPVQLRGGGCWRLSWSKPSSAKGKGLGNGCTAV